MSVAERENPASFQGYLEQEQRLIDAALQRFLPAEWQMPTTIHKAMRYSVFAGGKRLRPLLVLASGRATGGHEDSLLPAACAVEMIHTYSLVHDDLPALDNDDLRRGRPTSHRVFGVAMAILAGDALLTRAFEILACYPENPALQSRRLEVLQVITSACGTEGLIGGQVIDLESEGQPADEATIHQIHSGKTGALIRASVRAGAIMAGASSEELMALDEYAQRIGLAFQIIDDVLDVVETSAELGKTPGKDAHSHKATYPMLLGVEGSRQKARLQIDEAIAGIGILGARKQRLVEIAEFVYSRHH
jgi:geranylgeranyl diphosphate synthase type II